MDKSKSGDILDITKADRYRTVEELFERSKPNSSFYTLLILSTLIITSGLLLNNSTIVIGGMLLTPVLTPILLVGLGLSVGELRSMKEVGVLIGKSLLVILVSSFVIALVFGYPQDVYAFEDTARAALLYFIVAILSGVVGAFAWARKEILDILPGVAIAVSLVPPLSLVGIWVSALDLATARFYFSVFVLNFVGVLLGSLVVFSLLRFSQIRKEVREKSEETNGKK